MNSEFIKTIGSVVEKCKSGTCTFTDLSEVVRIIRENIHHVDKKTQAALLEPVYEVLLVHAKLSPNFMKDWNKSNNEYLAGNLNPTPNDTALAKFSKKYRDILSRDGFELSIIILMFRDLLDNYEELANDFNIRDIEVTLRDDLIPIDPKAFIACEQGLAEKLTNALN